MSAAANARDFPDWLGPMLVKELRQGLKTKTFVLSFIGLQVVFVVVLVYHALLYRKGADVFDASGLNGIFWFLVGFQLLFVTPLRALNDLGAERKANTLELIFVTGLTPWRIVMGKWASLIFQSVLFVLAVLPYGILRYYFGGVNLTEELAALGMMLLLCGVLSAMALAISGLPVILRIAVVVLGFVAGMFGIGNFLDGVISRAITGAGASFDPPWYLILFDGAVLMLCALQVGASTIAPPSENHALRQRLASFLLLVPVPFLHWFGAPDGDEILQLFLFAALCLFTGLHHLAAPPALLRRHFEPFARLGAAGFLPAIFFQPGPAGAALYLMLGEGALLWTGFVAIEGGSALFAFGSSVLMIGAALLAAPVVWKLIGRKSRWALAEQIVFLIFCGCIPLFLLNLKPDAYHFSATPLTVAFPPAGLWLMLDRNGDEAWGLDWFPGALVAFVAYALLLELLFIAYWRQAWALFSELRRPRRPPPPAAPS